MSMLTLAVPSPCPQSADGQPHICQSDDSTDLISYGPHDHGVSVYLSRCRSCAVALLTVIPVSGDLRSGGPVLEVDGAEL